MRRSFLSLLLFWPTILLAVEPEQAGVDHLETAKIEFRQGDLERAAKALDLAEAQAGPTGLTLDLRGSIFMEQGKFTEAMEAFKAAQAKNPSAYLPRLHLGEALFRQGKWKEARAVYEALMRETNILIVNERLRYSVLMTYLGAKDDSGGQGALDRVMFPTESPAYYYAQAAWAFAHGSARSGKKWLRAADEIFDEKQMAWFARPLHDFGWLKTKPPLTPD